MLLVGQSAQAAADDGMFPRVFARLNRHGVPGVGLLITAGLMTIVLFATRSPTLAGQFNHLVDLAVILVIVPYVYAAVSVVKVIADRQLPAATFQTYKWLALVAVVYCLWAVVGGDPATVVRALVALLVSVPLYPFFIRSMEAAAKRHSAERGALELSARRPHPSRNESPTRPKKELRYANALHEYDPHPEAKRAQSRGVVRAGCARVAHGRLVSRVRPGHGARERAAAGPAAAEGARLEVQLRRGPRWVRLRELAVHEPEARGALGDLSDNWFEGSLKPAVTGVYTTSSTAQFYGKLSAVGERTYGAAPSLVGGDESSFGLEDLYVGWRSGDSLGLGKDALDFTIGRAPYAIGHHDALGMAPRKAARAAATGATRARRSSGPRSGASRPVTTCSRGSISTRTTCPEADSSTKLWGANYQYAIGEDTTLGASYLSSRPIPTGRHSATGSACTTCARSPRRSRG